MFSETIANTRMSLFDNSAGMIEKCDYGLLSRKALDLVRMEENDAPSQITGVQVEGATAADNAKNRPRLSHRDGYRRTEILTF